MDISNVASAVTSGLRGLQSAEQGVAEASRNINEINTKRETVAIEADRSADVNQQNRAIEANPNVSLHTEAVNLVVNEHLAKANVKVIKTADEMVGTLIDTKV